MSFIERCPLEGVSFIRGFTVQSNGYIPIPLPSSQYGLLCNAWWIQLLCVCVCVCVCVCAYVCLHVHVRAHVSACMLVSTLKNRYISIKDT